MTSHPVAPLLPHKVLQSTAKSASGRFEACGWLNYTHHTIWLTSVINRRPRRSRRHARSDNRLKYEGERGGLAMSTGAQQPSARLYFFTGGLLYFESNSYSFCDAYCRGHTGSRPERAIGSLWHRHPEGAWKTLPTTTLSWLSFIPNTVCHLALLSRSLGNLLKEAPGL